MNQGTSQDALGCSIPIGLRGSNIIDGGDVLVEVSSNIGVDGLTFQGLFHMPATNRYRRDASKSNSRFPDHAVFDSDPQTHNNFRNGLRHPRAHFSKVSSVMEMTGW